MKRPVFIWIAFTVCAAIGLGVLGWFSSEMLRLDRQSAEIRRLAAVEENVRLALWRLDSAMAVIQGTESARPPAEYQQNLSTGGLPSPLLGRSPPFVRLHFQAFANGRLESPQTVSGRERDIAMAAGVPAAQIDAAWTAMDELQNKLNAGRIRSALAPAEEPAVQQEKEEGFALADLNESLTPSPPPPSASAPAYVPPEEQRIEAKAGRAQQAKSEAELQRREELLEQQTTLNIAEARNRYSKFSQSSVDAIRPIGPARKAASSPVASVWSQSVQSTDMAAGLLSAPGQFETGDDRAGKDIATLPVPATALLQPIWIDGELFLAREETIDGEERVQAVWLDWPELRAWLLTRITDLLPGANLVPIMATVGATHGLDPRRLAFLPVQLDPGVVPTETAPGSSLLGASLAAAWIGALLGLAALALLLHGTLRLSERRGTFVSAVTHELRTPLTTFRMYTEMLSIGMVTDETKRRSYLDTLRTEAERLSHLVENVLSYARLERGRASSRVEDTTPGDMIAAMSDRLRQRADQAGISIAISAAREIADQPLRTDISAVEQIVFNLVDNAAKYGRSPDGDGGHLEVEATLGSHGGRLAVAVSDRGPGIPPAMRKVLFRPFSKSATQAAHSQPGVGLGLALCRRLARQELGGDLVLAKSSAAGTTFRLEIPMG